MRISRVHAAVVALVVTAASSPAMAEEPRRVGIVVATAVNMTPAEVDEVAEQLGAALAAALPVDIIAGRETRRRLPPDGLPDECVAKPDCRQDIGKRLDAAELLMLVVVRIGGKLQIDATWANVASGNVTSRPAVVVEPGADRAKVFAAAAPSLLPHIEKPDKREGPDFVVVTGPTVDSGDDRHMTRGAWIATGIAAGAALGGTVFALSAKGKYDDLDAGGCRVDPCDQDSVDAVDRHALIADGLFAVAIGSGVTALVLYLRSGGGGGKGEPAPASTTTPVVTVGADGRSFGVSFGGRF